MKKIVTTSITLILLTIFTGCTASSAWNQTKKVSSETWEDTKEVSGEGWDAAKDAYNDAAN